MSLSLCSYFFFFNDTATTEIYTLSLHDALPILDEAVDQIEKSSVDSLVILPLFPHYSVTTTGSGFSVLRKLIDRKSTRLNSSHSQISYAVFCLKKKK